MKTILEIYKHYKIMPLLQEHQLRVASVAAMICDNIDAPIDRSEIISACLLHDMGNIIKFDLASPLNDFDETELEYWEDVQKEFRKKWPDEHVASREIAREIGINRITLELIENIGIVKSHLIAAENGDMNKKIGCYSDMRVGPHGILPLDERINDAKKRYSKKFYGIENDEQIEIWRNALKNIERDIFSLCTITPNYINDHSLESYFLKLRKFSVV